MSRPSFAAALALAALLLVACGGAKPAAQPPTPTPTDAERTLVTEAEALQADICACTDTTCLATVIEGRWEPTFNQAPADPTLTDDGAARFGRAYLTATRCAQTLVEAIDGGSGGDDPSGGKAAIVDMTALRDRACACKDQACLDQVMDDFMALGERHKDTKGSDADVEIFRGIFDEMQACITAVQEAGGAGGA